MKTFFSHFSQFFSHFSHCFLCHFFHFSLSLSLCFVEKKIGGKLFRFLLISLHSGSLETRRERRRKGKEEGKEERERGRERGREEERKRERGSKEAISSSKKCSLNTLRHFLLHFLSFLALRFFLTPFFFRKVSRPLFLFLPLSLSFSFFLSSLFFFLSLEKIVQSLFLEHHSEPIDPLMTRIPFSREQMFASFPLFFFSLFFFLSLPLSSFSFSREVFLEEETLIKKFLSSNQ